MTGGIKRDADALLDSGGDGGASGSGAALTKVQRVEPLRLREALADAMLENEGTTSEPDDEMKALVEEALVEERPPPGLLTREAVGAELAAGLRARLAQLEEELPCFRVLHPSGVPRLDPQIAAELAELRQDEAAKLRAALALLQSWKLD